MNFEEDWTLFCSPKQSTCETFTVSGISFNLIEIPAGTLILHRDSVGWQSALYNSLSYDVEVHFQSFWFMETPVTEELYKAVMGKSPSPSEEPLKNPVTRVSWIQANLFCEKLSSLIETKLFRLPTEVEWEYACTESVLKETLVSVNHPCIPVKSKEPNSFGLYDMDGNGDEWCYDPYSDTKNLFPLYPFSSPQEEYEDKVTRLFHFRTPVREDVALSYLGFRCVGLEP